MLQPVAGGRRPAAVFPGTPLAPTTAAMKRTLIYGVALAGLCLALAFITLVLSGCSTLAGALNIQNPTYTIHNVQPHVALALPLNASTIDFDFNVGIDNPNSVGLNLARLDFGVLVNGNRVVDSVTSDRVAIPARGSTD